MFGNLTLWLFIDDSVTCNCSSLRCLQKKPDYWENAKKMLSDAGKFLDALMKYDKDNIAQAVVEKIQPYMQVGDAAVPI